MLKAPLGFPTPSGSVRTYRDLDTSVLLVAVEWRASDGNQGCRIGWETTLAILRQGPEPCLSHVCVPLLGVRWAEEESREMGGVT